MDFLKVEDGFSLLELLVVVAIIGVLAAVGTFGYGNYIDNAKQKALEANYDSIKKLILTDTDVDSEFNPNRLCSDYVKDIVSKNSAKKVYNSNTNIYVNGHCAPSSTIDEGQIFIACEDPNALNNEIYVCGCDSGGGPCTCASKPTISSCP